ncbi:nucleotide sugar dehydrogenase [Gordonia jacobaea]|uniref:UDP-glucose 6-dehydrogenase n=1 Tax=Gordonia jacobaea TaxID=122202 RepID=A0ABR5I7D2_9ACTN|nr:nucleotide sugar dehydrogenase [Gordonia jacobaea]KNA89542.1 GDP-mannose dehydrogenase [Gordonia jacobaea]
MKIAIVGMGYVGVTAAACLAAAGNRIVGVDPNPTKVRAINAGASPISEPEVDRMIALEVAQGNLEASEKLPTLDDDFQLVIVCVGTPSAPDGSHNMTYIAEATRQIATAIDSERRTPITVAFRSTFRPGTMEDMIAPLFEKSIGETLKEKVELVYYPEFLREATAVKDFYNPPKIVVGTKRGTGSKTLNELNKNISAPLFNVTFPEAEITKFVDNTWHALKVSFANEIGRIAYAHDISAQTIADIFTSDTQLNISAKYLRPGGAFGGSCLPKDVRAFVNLSDTKAVSAPIISAVIGSNEAHKSFQFERAVKDLDPGSSILLLGLAFKAGTDDLRESPHVDLAASLIESGFHVRIYEPHLKTADLVGQNLGYIYGRIPGIDEMLVDADHAKSSRFDRVIECTQGLSHQIEFQKDTVGIYEID